MKKCPSCGQELPDTASFCMYCGNAIPESNTKNCPHCGFKDLPQEAVFCPNCGKELSPKPSPKPQPTPQPAPQPQPTPQPTPQPNPAPQPKPKPQPLLVFPKPGIKERDGLHVGDYFYDDGTTSSELIQSKKAVGVVFSLETTEEEKKHGWTHGHIFALSGIKIKTIRKYPIFGERLEITKKLHWTRGSDNATQIFSGSENRSLFEAMRDKGGLIYTNDPKTNDPNYEVFTAARAYNTICPLPQFTTSGWYLPAIGQLYELLINLGGIPESSFQTTASRISKHPKLIFKSQRKGFIQLMQKYGFNDNNSLGLVHNIASSSEYGKAWCWNLMITPYDSYENMYIETIAKHNVPSLEVYAVAAF